MRAVQIVAEEILNQRGHLYPWTPVFLAIGIAVYFAQLNEPAQIVFLIVIGIVAVGSALAWRSGPVFAPFVIALVLIATGFLLAGYRANAVKGPVLGWRYYGPVQGRIVAIDRSGSDALRLTLDHVVLERVAPDRTPHRVRVSLHGAGGITQFNPGMVVMTTAHLSPPSGPVEPTGFDFQRHAWFQRLGAIGYSRVPILALENPNSALRVFKWRMAFSARVQSRLNSEIGGVATAIVTGDRSAIGKEALAVLRASNLAHLLAISGLHMGLLAGFVFAVFRLIFAALPWVGLRVPGKKLSAGIALVAAAGYLILSGAQVATERAFVMVAVALLAVVLDRRAFSLRAVATAALVVLVLRPEALISPGFQMSFAATTALIAVFGLIRDYKVSLGPSWLRPISAVVISSVVAGAATGPVGAAHFNQISHFGLLANLLSVPLMGVLVMPAAVIGAFLMPFGLDALAYFVMGLGLQWILLVAGFVAGLEGAVGYVVSPQTWVLPLMALGFLALVLWQGPIRFLGGLPVIASVLFWINTDRPTILIASDGGLVGVMVEKGRALSKEKGAGFTARNWLENDGDGATSQFDAAVRWDNSIKLGAGALLHVRGKRAAEKIATCDVADFVVMNVVQPKKLPCRVFDTKSLRETGSLALYPEKGGVRIVTARQITGNRLWNSE